MKTSEIIGLPVVTVDGGEDVAEIRDVVYAGDEGSLVGFTLNKRGFFAGRMRQVLSAETIAAVGPAAVMIDSADGLLDRSDAPDAVADPATDRNVLNDPVVTEDGVRLGTVVDLVVEVGSRGTVVGYELAREGTKETRLVPRPQQVAVSGDALLVPTATADSVSEDLSGFALAVDKVRAVQQ